MPNTETALPINLLAVNVSGRRSGWTARGRWGAVRASSAGRADDGAPHKLALHEHANPRYILPDVLHRARQTQEHQHHPLPQVQLQEAGCASVVHRARRAGGDNGLGVVGFGDGGERAGGAVGGIVSAPRLLAHDRSR